MKHESHGASAKERTGKKLEESFEETTLRLFESCCVNSFGAHNSTTVHSVDNKHREFAKVTTRLQAGIELWIVVSASRL